MIWGTLSNENWFGKAIDLAFPISGIIDMRGKNDSHKFVTFDVHSLVAMLLMVKFYQDIAL